MTFLPFGNKKILLEMPVSSLPNNVIIESDPFEVECNFEYFIPESLDIVLEFQYLNSGLQYSSNIGT